ncbi:hypothetical protein E1B28_000893 [Marasmius oreades]|uniref:DRBM domain-containing protein n=1 Tax=Marasmius oreades TaxID=181124 RepID=A0A9P7V2A5_9AGAR|nr:uncharacterized protein E1B28_000893 [Marasmius oreades]KAG7099009.1 hypothetical protein E1B28_000893 [Marasmius oreades]
MNTAYFPSSISSIHLKRTHTEANHGFTTNLVSGNAITAHNHPSVTAAAEFPPLPRISGEFLLQVYTHKSLRRSEDVTPEEFEDSERLAVLGEKVLSAAVTSLLFSKRPMKGSAEILQSAKYILSDSRIDKWVTAYKLREKVRCTPEAFKKLKTPEETRLLFYAFVGGLYVGSGLDAVCDWLDLLTGSSNDIGSGGAMHTPAIDPSGPPPTYRPSTSPPQKRMRQEPLSPQSTFTAPSGSNSGIFFASQPPDSPSRATSNSMAAYNNHYGGATTVTAASSQPQLQPHHPPAQPHYQSYHQHPNVNQSFSPQAYMSPPAVQRNPNPPFNPLSPAQPHLAFLPLFNQTAAQRKVKVDYQAQFSGPSHAGKWSVQCVVNGIPKGMGSGGTKQVAKEEAARQAYYAMGWT